MPSQVPPRLIQRGYLLVVTTDEIDPGRDWYVIVGRCIAGAVLLIGLVLVFGATPGAGLTDWPSNLVSPGATLATGGAAGLVALAATQSIQARRREESVREARAQLARVADADRARREVAYEELLAHMTKQFTGQYDPSADAQLRARIATWGDERVIAAVGNFNRAGFDIVSRTGGRIPADDKPRILNLYYEVYASTQVHLQHQPVSKDTLLSMVFNDYVPPRTG